MNPLVEKLLVALMSAALGAAGGLSVKLIRIEPRIDAMENTLTRIEVRLDQLTKGK